MQDPAEYVAQFSNMFGSGPAGGGFGALIKTSPVRPHGVLFWSGGNSVLNARPFVITGQPDPNPSYNSNSYGGALAGRPMLPGLPQSKRDFVLLSYYGVMFAIAWSTATEVGSHHPRTAGKLLATGRPNRPEDTYLPSSEHQDPLFE